VLATSDFRDGNAVIGKVRRCLTPETSVNSHGKMHPISERHPTCKKSGTSNSQWFLILRKISGGVNSRKTGWLNIHDCVSNNSATIVLLIL